MTGDKVESHSEQSEESKDEKVLLSFEILRFAQDDAWWCLVGCSKVLNGLRKGDVHE